MRLESKSVAGLDEREARQHSRGPLLPPDPFMADETSLLLLKPDAVAKNLAGEALQRLLAEGFRIRGIKMLQLTDELLKEHYSHIADRPFFPEVAGFMKSKPVIALALAGENVAIAHVRDLLGPTDSKAAPKAPSVATLATTR